MIFDFLRKKDNKPKPLSSLPLSELYLIANSYIYNCSNNLPPDITELQALLVAEEISNRLKKISFNK